MPPFFWIVLIIVIISTVVGAVAKMLNNMNEMNAQRNNRPPARAEGGGGGGGGGAVRQSNSDMDRFLAEIDRLRKKNADAPPPQPGQAAPAAPVVQPTKQPDRPRPRVVAELAEPPARPGDRDVGFGPPALPAATTGPKAGDLPIATVVTPPSGTGAPAATRVTRIAGRPRPVAKTPFAKSLTGLLNGGQGLAMAIVLQEILGPPKCQKQ
jgi:hypothetical protein